MSTLQFWLSFNNGAERLQLPVNPERIDYTIGTRDYMDVSVASLGEMSVIGDGKLSELSFSSHFPLEYNETYCEYPGIPTPWDAVSQIRSWIDSRKPMRVAIAGTPINLACTIRSFNVSEEFGAVGDIYYDISFKEYKFVQLRTMTTQAPAGGGTATAKPTTQSKREDPRTPPKTYTVVKGDTLSKIALKLLGSANKYPTIASKNGIKPPYTIYPGQVLKL